MIVISTTGIELRPASGAGRFAFQILGDREFYSTGPAEYCSLVPCILRPCLDLVIGERCVAVLARIIDATALHFDRNNIGWPVIVFAASLGIYTHTEDVWKS